MTCNPLRVFAVVAVGSLLLVCSADAQSRGWTTTVRSIQQRYGIQGAQQVVQPTRDLSGAWTMDLARSEAAQQGEGVEPVSFVITQTATQVRVETRRGNKDENVLYPLTKSRASASPAPAPTVSGQPEAYQPEAYWDGDKLVTETQRLVDGYTVTVKEAHTLGPSGRDMTVETTVIVQHGYSMAGAKNYGTSKDVFMKNDTLAARDTSRRR